MRNVTFLLLSLLGVAADWPTWRGPKSDGIVSDGKIPTKWSDTTNIAWKVTVPGVGHSSPVVSNGRVFLTSYDTMTDERLLLAYRADTGEPVWKKSVLTAKPEKMHKNNTPASSTPVADESHVWTTFLDGDRVAVACFTHTGERVWLRHPGSFLSQHGFCGTPILVQDLVIINGDNDGADAFLAALDKKTGEKKWKVARPNRTRSFSVPRLIEIDGQPQLILAGSKSIVSFHPKTGEQLWIVDSVTDKFVATVAATEGLIFATGTSPNNTLTAIDPRGNGNITKTHVRWLDTKTAAYVPSPLAFGNRLFVLSDAGIASMLDAKTGRVLWSERLPGRLYHASPLMINGRIYCFASDGSTHILDAGDTFEVHGTNSLRNECHATPAIVDGAIYLRSTQALWCIRGSRDGSK